MEESRIYLSAPDVRGNEREYVLGAIDSNWLAPAGPDLNHFEHDLAAASGRKFAVALSSGTAAIHLGLLQLGVRPGDSVICSSLTFAGSANPIIYCGAKPIFVDSESKTWNIDPELMSEELTSLSKINALPAAAVIVDLYGNCAEYTTITSILRSFEIPMLEDAAEALGSSYSGQLAGSFGEHAILSFNGNKIITSSGGGAFVTDDADAADRVRYLSTQARQDAVHYEHTEVGYNYRMSNLCAALGRAQLETLPDRVARRREIHNAYMNLLGGVEGIKAPGPLPGATSNYWLTCITVDPLKAPASRDHLIKQLADHNIESRPVWKPMHMQPVFTDSSMRENGVSQRLFEQGICLPSGSGMTDGELGRVLTAIDHALS